MNYFKPEWLIEDFLFRIAIWKHIVLQYTEKMFKRTDK